MLWAAGTAGGSVAGVLGGLFYGFAGASQPPGPGGASALLVLVCLNIMVGTVGAAGVALGIAATGYGSGGHRRSIVGGALGGLTVGAGAKLLGTDAFNLLFGRSPGDITGAPEGALLGAAVGFGIWLAGRAPHRRALERGIVASGMAGAVAGALIALLGGRLMGGSLDLLARGFPGSHLRLDAIGSLFGETGFGPVARIVTSGVEGALFGGCVAGAMILAQRGRRAKG
jgi:hypothetical protein